MSFAVSILDVANTLVDHGNLFFLHIDTDYTKACLRRSHSERDTDITQTHNTHFRLL